PMMTKFVTEYKATGKLPKNVMGSVKDDSVKLSPYGPGVAKETQDKIEDVKGQMVKGTFQMFKGPLKDNQGNVVIPDGKAFGDQDLDLWKMNYLVEGVKGDLK